MDTRVPLNPTGAVVELDDMFGAYPTPETPGVQTLITAKQEFNELASTVTEPIPKRGHYFKHQQFIQRIMKVFPSILMMHQTGTGKTCSFVAFSEYCRQIHESGGNIKRVYVLVKGPSLKNEFRNQLVCRCTAGEYETDLVKNATNEAARKGNITREIKKWYSIKTYTKFANNINSKATKKHGAYTLTDEEIITKYSDCAFFVDEIQNLGLEEDPGLMAGAEQIGETEQTAPIDDIQRIYRQLWRVFHLAQRTRIVLASATPMVNGTGEIPYPMNLILPADRQMPTDGSIDYNTATLEQLEPYFRGKISFVREMDTGAVARYEGERIETEYEIAGRTVRSQLIVYASRMSPELQEIGYRNAQQNPSNFRLAERQAASFVFPDGSYGGTAPRMVKVSRKNKEKGGALAEAQRRAAEWGFGRWVVSDAPDLYRPVPELLPWISNLEYMRHLSCKYAETVRLCRDNPGNCWVYNEFVSGSGAVVEGLCFEAMGFERFNENSSVFVAGTGTQTVGGLSPYCAPAVTGVNRRIRIAPRLRYALLTSETLLSGPKLNAILELMNSYENRHGAYIKVLIGSQIAREGLSISNCLQIHVPPTWNESAAYQALSRALRATSHDDLIQEERRRLISVGEDPDTARVIVNIYRHAALTSDGTSVDLEMYQLSEYKNRQIARMLRIMKQCAIDCQVHYQRNVRPNDVNGSPACDYEECAYRCVDPTPDFNDTTTYDLYYSDNVVAAAVSDLVELFRNRFSITIDDLYRIMTGYRPKFVLMAVEKMITDKIMIYDRYGYQSYVQIDNDTVFLTRDFPTDPSGRTGTETVGGQRFPLSYYSKHLVANLPASLSAHVNKVQSDEQFDIIQQLATMSPETPEFHQTIELLNIDNKVSLLENAVEQFVLRGVTTPTIAGIIAKYQTVLYMLHEPITEITQSALALANRGKGRGRKPNPNTKLKLKKINPAVAGEGQPVVDTDTEQVYINTLYNQVYDRVAYAVTSRYNKADGRIRLLKPSEGIGWRDANPYELPVYNAIVQREIARRSQQFEQFGIYGTILYDNEFRIVDKAAEKGNLAATDARMFNRGKKCRTWLKHQLVDLMWRLQLRSPDYDLVDTTGITRNDYIQFLLNQKVKQTAQQLSTMDDAWLRFYYTWHRSGMNRVDICDYIRNHFQQTGRLMVV